ncbi:MAG: hypothetical protein HY328_13750, partial [Chloroflexi bacterium]|nr:hypothetical protein [Chloroflexota bacterium]
MKAQRSKSAKSLSRREFLLLGAGAATSVALAACAPAGPAPAAEAPAAAAPAASAAESAAASSSLSSVHEAPMLRALVDAGQLPPLSERLPKAPMVVDAVDGIGQYGAEWRGATAEVNANFYIRNGGYQQLLRWTPKWDGIIPNLAESYEANADSTEFTFHLREGILFSDGEPLTADDILFWYEDMLMNEEYTPSIPKDWTSGGDPVVVEKIDQFTVKFKFTTPYGLFIKQLATTNSDRTCHYPKHYLQQF